MERVKALLSVKIAPSERGCQKTVTYSGDDTNIVPKSRFNKVKKLEGAGEDPYIALMN